MARAVHKENVRNTEGMRERLLARGRTLEKAEDLKSLQGGLQIFSRSHTGYRFKGFIKSGTRGKAAV